MPSAAWLRAWLSRHFRPFPLATPHGIRSQRLDTRTRYFVPASLPRRPHEPRKTEQQTRRPLDSCRAARYRSGAHLSWPEKEPTSNKHPPRQASTARITPTPNGTVAFSAVLPCCHPNERDHGTGRLLLPSFLNARKTAKPFLFFHP